MPLLLLVLIYHARGIMAMQGTMGGIAQNAPEVVHPQRVQPVLQTAICHLVPPAVIPVTAANNSYFCGAAFHNCDIIHITRYKSIGPGRRNPI